MLSEAALSWGPLWPNVNYIEHTSAREDIIGPDGRTVYQTLVVKLAAINAKMRYTDPRGPVPLTLAACHPGWKDFLDLDETLKMADRLMEEDAQTKGASPPKEAVAATVMPIPPTDAVMVPANAFPGSQWVGASRDNPVHLSDATEVPKPGSCRVPDAEVEDDEAILGHFSDTLKEMAASITELEEGYFRALSEVVVETERALRDVSLTDAHYVSQVVTLILSWQSAVQTAATHMDGVDITAYQAAREDVRRATHDYVKQVLEASKECNAAHVIEQKRRNEAVKKGDMEDPVVCLLHVTHKAACAQGEKVVTALLCRIDNTLHDHVSIPAQGPLVANALSTAFQFQMAIWRMVGDECVCPVRAKHSDWCGMAGIVQVTVETFPQNCALMFPLVPTPQASFSAGFSSTFKPASSADEDDDNDDTLGAGGDFPRFSTSTPTPSGSRCRSAGMFSDTLSFASNPLLDDGAFTMASDNTAGPSGASLARVVGPCTSGSHHAGLDLGEEADEEEELD